MTHGTIAAEGVGAAQKLDLLLDQCDTISRESEALVVGSAGRLVYFGDDREFRARGEEDFFVRDDGSLRDIDVLAPAVDTVLPADGPFPIDSSLKKTISVTREGERWQIYDRSLRIGAYLRPEIFEPHPVTIDGRTINILNAQTMCILYDVYGMRKQDKIARSLLIEAMQDDPSLLPVELYKELTDFLAERSGNRLFKARQVYRQLVPPQTQKRLSPVIHRIMRRA